jgi:hypothetical protein
MVFQPLQLVAGRLLTSRIVCVVLALVVFGGSVQLAQAESECGAGVVANPVGRHLAMDASMLGIPRAGHQAAHHIPTPCERGMCHAPTQLPLVPPSSPNPPNFDQLFGPLSSLSIHPGESRDTSFAAVVIARAGFQRRLERPPECAVVI